MSKPKADRNIKIPQEVLRKLLTASETRMLNNRYKIMNLLNEDLSIRKIAERLKVGTDTVSRVARMIEKFPKVKRIKSKTPWIFGKSE